jgi:tRNA 2-selenouridine synthase
LKGKVVPIEQLFNLEDVITVDVRSPSEYVDGTIPGSINIPLFDDTERTVIGTIYKQDCPQKATEKGYEIAASKLPDLYSRIKALADTYKNVVMFCWRGGLRSQSLVEYCNEREIECAYLLGGYKSYRRLVNSFFEDINNIPDMIVLVGLTGIGKTRLLSILSNQYKLPTIDLEELANNKGSVFGQIHGGIQPSQKNFDARLYEQITKLNRKFAFIECESKRLGQLHLPDNVFIKMKKGLKIHLYASIDIRVSRIVEDYAHFPKENLINSLEHLKKRLGKNRVGELVEMVKMDKFDDVAYILLKEYYDPLYGYPDKRSANNYDLSVNCDDLNKAAHIVNDFIIQKGYS